MISSGWAAFGLGIATVICAVVGSWAVTQYRQNQSEERDKAFTAAISGLVSAIREVSKEIKGLLFNAHDAGRPFYRRADDCANLHRDCRTEMDERLKLLEDKSHDHSEFKRPNA